MQKWCLGIVPKAPKNESKRLFDATTPFDKFVTTKKGFRPTVKAD